MLRKGTVAQIGQHLLPERKRCSSTTLRRNSAFESVRAVLGHVRNGGEAQAPLRVSRIRDVMASPRV